MLYNVFIWFLDQENIGLDPQIIIVHEVISEILEISDFEATILKNGQISSESQIFLASLIWFLRVPWTKWYHSWRIMGVGGGGVVGRCGRGVGWGKGAWGPPLAHGLLGLLIENRLSKSGLRNNIFFLLFLYKSMLTYIYDTITSMSGEYFEFLLSWSWIESMNP